MTTASTVFARIFIGVVCDRFGPRYGEHATCTMPANRQNTLLSSNHKISFKPHPPSQHALPACVCPFFLSTCMPIVFSVNELRLLLTGRGCCNPSTYMFILSKTLLCFACSVWLPSGSHCHPCVLHGGCEERSWLHCGAYLHRLRAGLLRGLPVLVFHHVFPQRCRHVQCHCRRLG